jgi:enoyl-CoA hydratase
MSEDPLVKYSAPFRGENVGSPVFEKVRVEMDGAIGRIVLNSPEKRNPLGYRRILEIGMAAKQLELDEGIKVIILKGEGKDFCAGYDITPSTGSGQQATPTEHNYPGGGTLHPESGYIHPDRDWIWQSYNLEHMRVYFELWDLQKPVIAQIQGNCLAGGSELAAFCDLRIVAENAKIGWPVSRNWSPGNVQYMPWLTNITKAKYYMLTQETMDGHEAFRCDWASKVVSAERLEEETERIARVIALTDTGLAMMTKRSINRQLEIMGFRTGLASGSDIVSLAFMRPGRDDEFERRVERDGLTAAIAWRNEQLRR